MDSPSPTPHNPWLVAIVVSMAAFMEVLDTTITNVSLSHIAGTLGASQDESTWVLTSYLVANGIVLPLSGWLSGVLGRKRFFMLCIGAFTVASLFCGLSVSLPMLIFFRLLQGLAGGGLQPTQQAIIIDAFPPEKRGAAFGVTGITMIVAPILGPTLGGYITDNFSWQWIFFMNVPVGILAFWLVGRMVVDPPQAKAKGLISIDYIGLSLVALGLGALQIMLDKGQQDDWFSSPFIVTFALISFMCLSSAVIWMLGQKDPVIDLRLLARPNFGMSCLMIFVMGFCLYGGSTLLPILTQSEFGYDSTTAGLVLSPSGFVVVFLMPVVGRLVNYVPARYLIALGMALCSFGMWVTMHINPQINYGTFVAMRVLQVLGLPFLFVPISTLAFIGMPKEKSSNASAIYAMARNLGGSIGIALIISYQSRHQQVHQTYLSAHLLSGNSAYESLVARSMHFMTSQGVALASQAHASMAQIYQQLLKQSDILAFSDAYGLMSGVMFSMAMLAFFMPHNDPHARKNGAGAGAH